MHENVIYNLSSGCPAALIIAFMSRQSATTLSNRRKVESGFLRKIEQFLFIHRGKWEASVLGAPQHLSAWQVTLWKVGFWLLLETWSNSFHFWLRLMRAQILQMLLSCPYSFMVLMSHSQLSLSLSILNSNFQQHAGWTTVIPRISEKMNTSCVPWPQSCLCVSLFPLSVSVCLWLCLFGCVLHCLPGSTLSSHLPIICNQHTCLLSSRSLSES